VFLEAGPLAKDGLSGFGHPSWHGLVPPASKIEIDRSGGLTTHERRDRDSDSAGGRRRADSDGGEAVWGRASLTETLMSAPTPPVDTRQVYIYYVFDIFLSRVVVARAVQGLSIFCYSYFFKKILYQRFIKSMPVTFGGKSLLQRWNINI
jgi:hypothetical protein